MDATPLFVVLLGELSRWGRFGSDAAGLLPYADRALGWIMRHGDRDGDGFVEDARMSGHGPRNQGWKDSHDGVHFADGRLAEPPIALGEVQGYVYAALLARAELARQANDQQTVRHWTAKATELKRAFHEQFWLPDKGWSAVGLDRNKTPIGPGFEHGALPRDGAGRRGQGAGRRRAPDVPRDVHRLGHADAGLLHGRLKPDELPQRVGLAARQRPDRLGADALRVRRAGAAARYRGAGHGHRVRRPAPRAVLRVPSQRISAPAPYPTSYSPQAWASATPIQLQRALLRLEPDLSRHHVGFAPAWPARYGSLSARDIRIGDRAVTVTVDGEKACCPVSATTSPSRHRRRCRMRTASE